MPKKSTFEEEYRKALAVYDSIVSEWEELGYRKGYQEGYQKGYQEGIEKDCQEAKKQTILKGHEYGVSMAILSLITHSSEEEVLHILAQAR